MTMLTLLDKGLRVSLPSREFYLNYYWDNCPDAFDTQTRERTFDIWARDASPRPATAEIVGDRLVIRWHGEDLVSRFDLSWLEKTTHPGHRADPAALPRKFWYADHIDHMARFTQSEFEDSETTLAAWARILLEEGIALVTDMRDDDRSVGDLAHLLGEIRSSVGLIFFDVRTRIAPENVAYTADALEMHTDTPAETLAPSIQYFHCRTNTVEGGDNLYIDGAAVASDFRAAHPEYFDILCRSSIPYFYEHDGFDWRAHHTVIELDDMGEISGLRISRHLCDAIDLPHEVLDDFYPA
jgi:gamma-butyrobetaine dioxygenase